MNLAIILVIAAAVALIGIVWISSVVSLQVSTADGIARQLQPIDIQAFRNLVDPTEEDYLRRRLRAREFRVLQRQRLRAMKAYVQAAGRNAVILSTIGQAAFAAEDAQTAEAGRKLVNEASVLQQNARLALFKITIALAWPGPTLLASPVLRGYERLNGSAMLLGRLQNPAAPIRISSTW